MVQVYAHDKKLVPSWKDKEEGRVGRVILKKWDSKGQDESVRITEKVIKKKGDVIQKLDRSTSNMMNKTPKAQSEN